MSQQVDLGAEQVQEATKYFDAELMKLKGTKAGFLAFVASVLGVVAGMAAFAIIHLPVVLYPDLAGILSLDFQLGVAAIVIPAATGWFAKILRQVDNKLRHAHLPLQP